MNTIIEVITLIFPIVFQMFSVGLFNSIFLYKIRYYLRDYLNKKYSVIIQTRTSQIVNSTVYFLLKKRFLIGF